MVVKAGKVECKIEGNTNLCYNGNVCNYTTLTASGGGTYKWTGPNGFTATTQAINVNVPGEYKVTVTKDGCSSTCSVVVKAGKVECKIEGDNVIKVGESATFTASGGGTYKWTGPDGFSATTATISGLTKPGEYTVTVTKDGCTSTCSRKLIVEPPVVCAYVVDLESVSYVFGFTIFKWSVYNPNPGNGYNGTIQDLSHFGIVLPDCVAACDVISKGEYGVDRSQDCYKEPYLKFDYGTEGKDKSYYIVAVKGKYTIGKNLAVFKAGYKTGCCVKEIKGIGCKEEECPTCEIEGEPVICNDGSTVGSTTLRVKCTGLTGPATYQWKDPNGNVIGMNESVVIDGASVPGVYTVEITSGKCKQVLSKEVKITNLACVIEGNPVVCNDASTIDKTTLTVKCTGNNGPTTYVWKDPNGKVVGMEASLQINGTGFVPGVYTVQITSGKCTKVLTKEVKISNRPECKIVGDTKVCFDGSSQNSTILTAAEGESYSWTGPGGFTATTRSITVTTVMMPAGTYTVTITTGGCSSTCSVDVEYINCPTTPPPAPTITTRKGADAMAEQATDASTTKLTVIAGPNPFQDRVRFVIKSKVSGKAALELYSMTGARVKTIYQGYVTAGKDQVVEYSLKGLAQSNFIYKVQVGGEQATGKLVSIQ